ncbi:MAG: hypothetical protein U9R32_09360 [Bacteroidota bacterium]|nr:hypothetical protein [Bacteroidota bacterium]
MEKLIAKWISFVFHPLLIPTYVLLLLFNLNLFVFDLISYQGKMLLLFLVFLVSYVMPVVIIFFYIKMDWVKSIYMESKEERILPIFTVALFVLGAAFLLKQLNISVIIYLFLSGMSMLSMIVLVITYYWKISLHTVAAGSIAGSFLGLAISYNVSINGLIYALILISGLVGFARLKLKAHNAMQVYAGYIVGFLFMFFLFIAA